ncbi:MAG: nitrate ABC transporter substrate-binding protein [Acidobacteria bacterium]|nr:MAG: nitrate ABC transporter substrate-binding protein [Acidobacteriota bacterium]
MIGRFLHSNFRKLFFLLLLCFAAGIVAQRTLVAQQKPSFTVGWSVYVGWNPYYYMAKSGILRRWADKYGIDIKVQRFDYAPSLDAFVAKNIDACAMTNMEALDMPAAAGVDTTAVLLGDYSNGNDAVITRQNLSLAQIPGKQVMLVEKTVSQYLFERAMTLNGLGAQIKQVRYINTSDADIAYAFLADSSKPAVVTWKPLVSQILKAKDEKMVFNSSQIPGEIMDLLVMRTEVLNRPDGSGQKFAKAIAGGWYELMGLMTQGGPAGDKVLAGVAEASKDSLASYKEQLSTTHMFYTPQSAVQMTSSPDIKKTMDLVRQFCFSHAMLGDKIKSPDEIGIQFADGTLLGKPDRIRLRFNTTYMQLAAQGKL